MRIAVIGGGIAGLVVAWLVKDAAEVVLYERDAWLGGHARSIIGSAIAMRASMCVSVRIRTRAT